MGLTDSCFSCIARYVLTLNVRYDYTCVQYICSVQGENPIRGLALLVRTNAPCPEGVAPHVTRAMSGVMFKNHGLVRELTGNTHTEQGLRMAANIIDKVYETGKKACKEIYDTGTIIFDPVLGKLNYKVRPATS
jgi:hypothetical protein